MSVFIKAGFWINKKIGFKGEFNLTKYIQDLITSTPVSKSYKIYSAILAQNSEPVSDPVAVVLENTIGEINWVRDSIGVSFGVLVGGFPYDKTQVFITASGQNGDGVFMQGSQFDTDKVIIINFNAQNNLLMEGFNSVSIEIRVYN